jgi:drug/metabolite transporter (DMT)-like permease
MAGQLIALPLFVGSVAKEGGGYFVLLSSSTAFALLFGCLAAYEISRGALDAESRRYLWSGRHWKVALIGALNAANGFGIVMTSAANRTPPALQSLLIQGVVPFTLLFSHIFLGKRYSRAQAVGALLVVAGLLVALVPLFESLAGGGATVDVDSHNWYFPIIYFLAGIPAVLLTIMQESVFMDVPSMNVNVLLALNCAWQAATVGACFWLDVVPGFGTSSSLHEVRTQLYSGLLCLFDPSATGDDATCQYAAPLMLLFGLAYVASYSLTGLLMKYASANYQAIVQAMGPPLSACFWFLCPRLNAWAGGKPYSSHEIAYDLGAFPLLVAGIIIFRTFELDSDKGAVSSTSKARVAKGDTSIQ